MFFNKSRMLFNAITDRPACPLHDAVLFMQKQIKQFLSSLLPEMQNELDTYKASRMKEIEQNVNTIVQKVAQQALNKSIPLADHNQLIIDARL